MRINPYRALWVIVMFDLPTQTATDKKKYAQFRKHLLEDGFLKLQYSVYARYCHSDKKRDVHMRRLIRSIPQKGEVRIITITEKQFSRMDVFLGKERISAERPDEQLLLF